MTHATQNLNRTEEIHQVIWRSQHNQYSQMKVGGGLAWGTADEIQSL